MVSEARKARLEEIRQGMLEIARDRVMLSAVLQAEAIENGLGTEHEIENAFILMLQRRDLAYDRDGRVRDPNSQPANPVATP